MNPGKQHAIITRAISHYGHERQLVKAAEEAAELSAAILRWHMTPEQETLKGLITEMADMYVMTRQLHMILYDVEEELRGEVMDMVDYKLSRLERRMDNDDA